MAGTAELCCGTATERFVVPKLNKALWAAKTMAEGGDGDLRYTLNKESAADVLSLLLQSGFSGHGLPEGRYESATLSLPAHGVAFFQLAPR